MRIRITTPWGKLFWNILIQPGKPVIIKPDWRCLSCKRTLYTQETIDRAGRCKKCGGAVVRLGSKLDLDLGRS